VINPSITFLGEEGREMVTTKMSTQYAGNIFFHATKKVP
jgi:hypothetical protein